MQLKSVWVLCLVASAYANIYPDFATKVLVQAAAQSTKINVIVSPYSLIAPLGTLSLASIYSTRRELLDVLGAENNTEIVDAYEDYKEKLQKLKNVTLLSANKLYISDTSEMNHRFNTRVQDIFNMEVESIDFTNASATKAEVSRWIKEKTNGNIYWRLKTTPEYKAAIVNAVLLNASWAEKFHLSGKHEFHVNKTRTVNVHFMRNFLSANHAYSEDLHAEVFDVPYEDEECSFVGVVPYVTNSIDGVLKSLANNGNVLNKVLQSQMSLKYLNLTMPVFDVFSTINVKQLLQNLGVQKLFDDAKLYHLLDDMKEMYVNEAFQKLMISVNTHGTHMDVVNVPEVKTSLFSFVSPDVNVLVDHPFYFEIRCSDITLVNGVIRNPMTHFKYDKFTPNLVFKTNECFDQRCGSR